MTKHITDTGHDRADGPRLREYLRLEKQGLRHGAAKALHQSPHSPRTTRQVKEYLRIERGRTT